MKRKKSKDKKSGEKEKKGKEAWTSAHAPAIIHHDELQ